MKVGVCTVQLVIPAAYSLKEKRRVVRSALERMRQRFNVSAAEVDGLDMWNEAIIGIACVSNDAGHAQAVLSKVVDWLAQERLDAEIRDYSIEVL
jgi:uncharacterized protein YlxP (DUF503 family)